VLGRSVDASLKQCDRYYHAKRSNDGGYYQKLAHAQPRARAQNIWSVKPPHASTIAQTETGDILMAMPGSPRSRGSLQVVASACRLFLIRAAGCRGMGSRPGLVRSDSRLQMPHPPGQRLFIGTLMGRPFSVLDLGMVAVFSTVASFATLGLNGIAALSPLAVVLRPFGLSYEVAVPLMIVVDPIAELFRVMLNVTINCMVSTIASGREAPQKTSASVTIL
jgi:hypothetical protein